jgi:four helix bundle protein
LCSAPEHDRYTIQRSVRLAIRIRAGTIGVSLYCHITGSSGDFCRQIRGSASSAPHNVAEGFGRFWPREFAHKLRIARGELAETQSALSVALRQKYVTDDQHSEMYRIANRAIGAATRLLQYLDTAGDDWKKGFQAAQRRPKSREGQTQ